MNYTVHGILQARILEWIAFPFSRGFSNPGIKPRSPALQADSLPAEPPGKLWRDAPWDALQETVLWKDAIIIGEEMEPQRNWVTYPRTHHLWVPKLAFEPISVLDHNLSLLHSFSVNVFHWFIQQTFLQGPTKCQTSPLACVDMRQTSPLPHGIYSQMAWRIKKDSVK